MLSDFRNRLLDYFLTFLWKEWSALGVLGIAAAEDEWVLDPEALLMFTLKMGRYEPRLFDEVLKWLLANGDFLDTARLKRIVQFQGDIEESSRLVGAAAQFAAAHGNPRKWQGLIRFCKAQLESSKILEMREALYKGKDGRPHPLFSDDRADPQFLSFGWNKPSPTLTEKPYLHLSKEVSANAGTHLRFLLRSLFGTGAKSEALLFLLTHDGGRPREIADDVNLFWLGIHQALLDLSRSGLVLARTKGRKTEYWLSHAKWWGFLASSSIENHAPPKWLNWVAIFSAFSVLWNAIDEIAQGEESDYLKSSKLQDALEVVAQEFSRAGFAVSRMPTPGLPPDLHQKMAVMFLSEIMGIQREVLPKAI